MEKVGGSSRVFEFTRGESTRNETLTQGRTSQADHYHLSPFLSSRCPHIQEYILYETHNLRRELLRAQEEVKRIKSVPLVIGQFLEAVDSVRGIVGSTTGSNYVVRILSTLDRELLKPSSSVALHRHSNALVDILPPEADSTISMLGAEEKPDVKYEDVGGLDSQKQEIREAVELPLTQVGLIRRAGGSSEKGFGWLIIGPRVNLVRPV